MDMKAKSHWRQERRIVAAYRHVVCLMTVEKEVSIEEVQGAVEYLLDAVKGFRVVNGG